MCIEGLEILTIWSDKPIMQDFCFGKIEAEEFG